MRNPFIFLSSLAPERTFASISDYLSFKGSSSLVPGETFFDSSLSTYRIWTGSVWISIVDTGGSAWGLSGNSGTNPSLHFLGTTDAVSLIIRTNNIERVQFDISNTIKLLDNTSNIIKSVNNDNNDAIPASDLILESGNKTHSSATGKGGDIYLRSGDASTTSSGATGDVFIITPNGHYGGNINIEAGNAAGVIGPAGSVNLAAGNSSGTNSAGSINIGAGEGIGAGNGGGVNVAGGDSYSGDGGDINISAGNVTNVTATTNAGSVNLSGGDHSGVGVGGSISLNAGNSDGNHAGSINLSAGNSNSTGTHNGGSVTVSAGNASNSGGSGNGGNITLSAGVAAGSGSSGEIVVSTNSENVLIVRDRNLILNQPNNANLLWNTDGAGDIGSPDGGTTLNRPNNLFVKSKLLVGDGVFNILSAQTTTTDNTTTTLYTYPIPNNAVVLFEARIVAIRTNGTGGDTATSAYYILRARLRRYGTNVFLNHLLSEESEDVAGWDADLDLSGTNARIRITGETGHDIDWRATILINLLTY